MEAGTLSQSDKVRVLKWLWHKKEKFRNFLLSDEGHSAALLVCGGFQKAFERRKVRLSPRWLDELNM